MLSKLTGVGVAGHSGTGGLGEFLGGIRIGLDAYIHTDRDDSSYVAALRLPFLRSHVAKLRAAFPFVVVDGICLLEAFGAIESSVDTLVYVKRISKPGIWYDGITIENAEDGEDLPQRWLQRSELAYHLARRPHENADFVYERVEA